MTVNKERVALLVADLRTTTEPQGKGYLKSSRGYCCLGRACEVAIANGLVVDVKPEARFSLGSVIFSYDGSQDVLPPTVRDWYGFSSRNPKLDSEDEGCKCQGCEPGLVSASGANDELGWDFAQIADALEARYVNGDADG